MSAGRETLWFALILILGFGIRVESLDRAVFSHPENYVPGWDDPDWVTAPYAKRSTLEGVLRANLGDGHPPLWFVAMLPWVRLTGDSLFALRFPSVVTGALCVFMVWRIVRRSGGPLAGLLAASWLAVHGHHVFWSRLARMYAPACLLALIAAWALLRILETPRPMYRIGFLFAAVGLVWTQIYGFPLLFAFGLVAADAAIRGRPGGRHSLRAVAVSVCLGAPVLSLAVYQNPPTSWADPWTEHLSFGFAFFSLIHRFDGDPPPWPQWPALAATLLALGAACAATIVRGPAAHRDSRGRADHGAPPDDVAVAAVVPSGADRGRAGVVLAALAAVAVQVLFAHRFARYAAGSERLLWGLCALPVLVIGAEFYCEKRWASIGGRRPATSVGPLLCLALVPYGAMAGVTLLRPSFVARGAVLFLPFLLAVAAHGIVFLLSRGESTLRRIGAATGIVLSVVALASFVRFHGAEASPRDYRTLSDALAAELRVDDALVAVQGGYADPPLLYYLRDNRHRIVPHGAIDESFPDAARRRIFAVVYDDDPFEATELPALAGRSLGRVIEAHRARAIELLPR
jgi:4-amino-4-deoxy-L-arabinose transferase-like glycosyltransferase